MGPSPRFAVLVVAVALAACLVLASLVAANVPAQTTPSIAGDPVAVGEGPAGAEDPAPAGEPAPEEERECPAGDSPQPEPEGEGEVEGCDPVPEEEGQEQQPPQPEPEPEAAADAGGACGAGCELAPAEPRKPAGGGAQVRRGATLDAGSRPRGRDSSSQASGGTEAAPRHSGGAGASGAGAATGGTAVEISPPRPDLGWAGPWAIPWSIVACESGGDYGALNPASGAGGAYQVLPSTWRAYGGRGSPQTVPAAEQDRIASLIWADSGAAAWECAWDGRYLGFGLAGALGPLPDPLPPARRLDAAYVSLTIGIARAERIDWGLLLAVIRVRGGRGPAPAGAAELRRLAGRIAALGPGPNRALAGELFVRGKAMRVTALAHYNRAVGRRGLVRGLTAVAGRLGRRVLASKRLLIYPGGRADVAAGRVDVRVLTLLLYLARRYDRVTVSSLISGHSFLTSGGRPSNHAFGQAVDVTALDGRSILGNQQPGGLAERALRWILLMPRELQAEELISLFDLGGPSFAAPDHADHIHVGF